MSTRRPASIHGRVERTQATLDGLAGGAVVVDRYGHAWQQGGASLPGYWYRAYSAIDGAETSSHELAQRGPVKVLWNPAANDPEAQEDQ